MALFQPCGAGLMRLAHRVVMAPMTRVRADRLTLSPTPSTVEYYRQRATPGGLLISEAVHISPEATPIWTIYGGVQSGGGQVPGIWTDTQVAAWASVTEAVHAQGGLMSCQLLHTGRIAQPEIKNHPIAAGVDVPLPPVSSSSVKMRALNQQNNDYNWDKPSAVPRALETAEVQRVLGDYEHAARNAKAAGFDCVELHAAHGYLVQQFMCDGVNMRTDHYGGSIANRCRFLFECVEVLLAVMGPGRVGVRLSPATRQTAFSYFDATDSDPEELYTAAVRGLNQFDLAYLLLTEPRCGGLSTSDASTDAGFQMPAQNQWVRKIYSGVLMGAGGFTPTSAARSLETGLYDLVAFGRWFVSNPDLVSRLRNGSELTVYERETFYSGGDLGYIDYPCYDSESASGYTFMEQASIGKSLCKK